MIHANVYTILSTIGFHMGVSRADTQESWVTAPFRRFKAELFCFLLIWFPHKHNNNTRKYLTLLVFFAWGAIEIGAAFGYATVPNQFMFLRGIVLVLLGRMWGLEINNFAGLEFIEASDRNENQDE